MTKSLRVACLQMNSIPTGWAHNLATAETLVADAAARGTRLAVLPELFAFGYDLKQVGRSDSGEASTRAFLAESSHRHDMCLIGGCLEESGKQLFNSLLVFDRGQEVARYRKMHRFPLSGETELFAAGEQPISFECDGIKIGLAICFDIRFPQLFRHYAVQGCHAVAVGSAFPFPRLDHWRTLLKARAIENQSYIIAANRCGKDDDLWFCGNSQVIDPWGVSIAQCDEMQQAVILADVQPEEIRRVRTAIPCQLHPWLQAAEMQPNQS